MCLRKMSELQLVQMKSHMKYIAPESKQLPRDIGGILNDSGGAFCLQKSPMVSHISAVPEREKLPYPDGLLLAFLPVVC